MSSFFRVTYGQFMNFLKSFFRMSLVILGLGFWWLTTSCTTGPAATRFLMNLPDKMVGLEVTYREGSPEYSHPATPTAEELDSVLQHIEVQPSSLLDRIAGRSSSTQEAFSEEQRGFFSFHFSRALKQATPLETVTFYWATPRGNGIWELTSGGLYIQKDELHLLLPNYRQTVPSKNPPQNSKNHPLSQIGDPLHSLKALDPAQQLTHNLATEMWAPQPPHFIFPLNKFGHAQEPSNHQQIQPFSPRYNSRDSITQRLKRLEKLRQEGLLTEKEYTHKRQEILNEL